MIKIAIVEDEQTCVKEMKAFIHRYEKDSGNRIDIVHYPDGATFIEE